MTTTLACSTSLDNQGKKGFWAWATGAVISYPLIWIGSSLALGELSHTSDVTYDHILTSGLKATTWRVALPHVAALSFALWWARRRNLAPSDLYVQKMPRRTRLLWVPAIAVPALIAVFTVQGSDVMRAWGTGAAIQALLLLAVGLGEETNYRGSILMAARRAGYSEVVAWGISTLAFGALHLPNVFLGETPGAVVGQFFTTMLLGFLFYSVLRQSSFLLCAVVCHALWDWAVGLGQQR